MKHILVLANETVAGHTLVDAVQARAKSKDGALVTVIAPISHPIEGYVIYMDTRRAAARRRLDAAVNALREAGVRAHGLVVDSDPVQAFKDALAQLDPPVTEVIVSTHPASKSGWTRRSVIEKIRERAGKLPVDHIVVDLAAEEGRSNVLVVANQTLLGDALLDRIRERASASPARFLIICPQSDLSAAQHPEAEARLRQAIAVLRGEAIETHGQIAHPDPFTAAMQAVHDERVDEIVVSTFSGERSGWLRRDLVSRLKKSTGLPVEHIVGEKQEAVTA